MCGILGIISFDKSRQSAKIDEALQTIKHRGPDDFGIWQNESGNVVLGHRRLSIIDLSAAGHQPMSNEDGSVWITFNGEIFNFQELRSQLLQTGHIFRSRTDTEVIIHAYEEWGVKCLDYLEGQFAFAIWDEKKQRVFLARDRVGIKPLYYYLDDNYLAFASELKALEKLPGLDLELDHSAMLDFLNISLFIPAPKSIYKKVRKMLPGHFMLSAGHNFQQQNYWGLNLEPLEMSQADYIEQFRELFNEAVRKRLISDVPLGVLLSGGMDSSSIVAAASNFVDQPLKTFSIGFDVQEHSEVHYAQLVADHFGTDHTCEILSAESLPRMLPQVIEMFDEPFADASALPTALVSSVAARQVTVVLAGDGGDELLGGYREYDRWLKWRKFQKVPLSGPLAKAARKFVDSDRIGGRLDLAGSGSLDLYQILRGGMNQRLLGKILIGDLAAANREHERNWFLAPHWHPEVNPIDAIKYADLRTYLPEDILTKVDRSSMASSLEARVPLLDHKLIEFVLRVPSRFTYNGGEVKKWILKQIMQDILPDDIIHRPKKGFSIPLADWLGMRNGTLKSNLFTGAGIERGFFHPDLHKILNSRNIKPNQYWSLVILDQWLAKHG